MPLSYRNQLIDLQRNQLIDLQSKSVDCFLYDRDIGRSKVNIKDKVRL